MSTDYNTPGVYIHERSTIWAKVAPVATAIPAFVGYTKNPVAGPVRIASFRDFVKAFGGPPTDVTITITGEGSAVSLTSVSSPSPTYILYYSLLLFYANGGGDCYVVSAGEYPGTASATSLKTALDALRLEDEPTLLLIPDAVGLTDQLDFHGLMVASLNQCSSLQDRFAIMDLYKNATVLEDLQQFRHEIGTRNLKYGAAYYPRLNTTLSFPDEALVFSHDTRTGPLHGKTMAEAVADAAAEPAEGSASTPISDMLSSLLTPIRDILATAAYQIQMPASPAIAGIYATVDRNRGVWQAPANVGLNAVLSPSIDLTNADQDHMNVDASTGKSVNAIRTFTGKGTMVWGARTLAGNDHDWRYVPVRRLCIMIEESIKKATAFVVFEPNNANTWLQIKTMTENFLLGLWHDGALSGSTPEEAFFVNAGLGSTMTQEDILHGRLVFELGVAAMRPAEFIILRFTQKLQES